MKLDANGGDYGSYKHIVVVFNAANTHITFTDGRLQGLHLKLHPVQKRSSDLATRQSTYDSQSGSRHRPRADHGGIRDRNRVDDLPRGRGTRPN